MVITFVADALGSVARSAHESPHTPAGPVGIAEARFGGRDSSAW